MVNMQHDPQQDDPKLKEFFEKADLEAETNLKQKGVVKARGWCQQFWPEKKRILKEKYNIDWKSPAEMNPGVFFD